MKLLAGGVVAYALSPIPVLGYLDDLVVVPAGLLLVRRLTPAELLAEHRAAAASRLAAGTPRSWIGAAIVISI
jgi:uncharacterized membrane protein YkvA (DUF1232 family)